MAASFKECYQLYLEKYSGMKFNDCVPCVDCNASGQLRGLKCGVCMGGGSRSCATFPNEWTGLNKIKYLIAAAPRLELEDD